MAEDRIWTLENIKFAKYDLSAAPRTVQDYTILIMVRGKGSIEIEHRSYGCSKNGKVLFCNPGTTIRYVQESPHYSVFVYEMTIGTYEKTLENDGKAVYKPAKGDFLPNGEWGSGSYLRVRELAESIEVLKRESEPGHSFKIQMLFYECLHLCVKDYESAKLEEGKSLIKQTVTYMQEHYNEDINRSQLAGMIGINKEYFSRLFKKETGRNFSEFLTDLRIKKAQEYLLTPKARTSLREIAQRVGYRNEFYLSQKFKQATGISPSVYIKKPKRIASVSSNYTACLLALGINPIIAKINPFIAKLFQQQLKSSRTQTIDLMNFQCNPMIAGASPDLVISYDTYAGLEELRRIAPTISIGLYQQNWREQFMEISSIVNAERKAELWLQRFDEKVEEARTLLQSKADSNRTVGIYEIWKDKILVFGDSYGRGGHIIYQHLNFPPPAKIREEAFTGSGYKPITLEELPQYAADDMFIMVFRAKGGETYASEIADSPIWKDLTADGSRRVYVNDHETFYDWDPISTEVQLEKIVQLLMS